MGTTYKFIETLHRHRFIVHDGPEPAIRETRFAISAVYNPERAELTVSASEQDGTYYHQRALDAGSYDDAVRAARREVPSLYKELPGHSLYEKAAAELAERTGGPVDGAPDRTSPAPPDEIGSGPRLATRDHFITMAEAAAILELSERHTWNILGGMPHIQRRSGRRYHVRRDAVQRLRTLMDANPHRTAREIADGMG